MPTDFNDLRRLYDNNQFIDLLNDTDGVYWLKLRSISRAEQLRLLCERMEIDCAGVRGRQLLEYVFEHRPEADLVESLIRELYEEGRAGRRENEDYLVSQLYQMRFFDWGGLYQNSLEQTIVNNYVKKIQDWEMINSAIENELHTSMRGYVLCSWYNHWSSILIEDIFKDHPAVLPVVGLVKKVDLFIHDFPFDLKVTYFPDGYMKELRRAEGLRPELTELKAFCRSSNIRFDSNGPASVLFPELLARVVEHPSQSARDFMIEFRATRARLIQQTVDDPMPLKRWLYENQGVRRFDAANRFFLILVDMDNLEDSWRLKRNKVLLADSINAYLDTMASGSMDNFRLDFQWQNETYRTYADLLFIVHH